MSEGKEVIYRFGPITENQLLHSDWPVNPYKTLSDGAYNQIRELHPELSQILETHAKGNLYWVTRWNWDKDEKKPYLWFDLCLKSGSINSVFPLDAVKIIIDIGIRRLFPSMLQSTGEK